MARAAFLMDKLFSWCGLSGKSFRATAFELRLRDSWGDGRRGRSRIRGRE